jgi:heat shock protein HslJ
MRKTRWAALAATALAAAAPVAAMAQAMPETATAAGNEPFWRADLADGSLTIQSPGIPPIVLSVTGSAVGDDGSFTLIAAATSPALGASLSFAPGPCADTMADQTYPFTAELALDDTVLTGCGGDPRLLLTEVETWQVETIAGDALLPETEVTLSFVGGDVVAGRAGCNRFSALYEITGEGLSLSRFAVTRMLCPGPVMAQERRFLELMEQVVSFRIRDDGGLTLVTRGGERIETRAP